VYQMSRGGRNISDDGRKDWILSVFRMHLDSIATSVSFYALKFQECLLFWCSSSNLVEMDPCARPDHKDEESLAA
jgi:hypothetical protein